MHNIGGCWLTTLFIVSTLIAHPFLIHPLRIFQTHPFLIHTNITDTSVPDPSTPNIPDQPIPDPSAPNIRVDVHGDIWEEDSNMAKKEFNGCSQKQNGV